MIIGYLILKEGTKGLRITTDSEYTLSDYFSSFNSNGFTVGSNGSTNYDGLDLCILDFPQSAEVL